MVAFDAAQIANEITADIDQNRAEDANAKLLEAARHPALSRERSEFYEVLRQVDSRDVKGEGADVFTDINLDEAVGDNQHPGKQKPFFDVLPNDISQGIYARARYMDSGKRPLRYWDPHGPEETHFSLKGLKSDIFESEFRVKRALYVTEKKGSGWDMIATGPRSFQYKSQPRPEDSTYYFLLRRFHLEWLGRLVDDWRR